MAHGTSAGIGWIVEVFGGPQADNPIADEIAGQKNAGAMPEVVKCLVWLKRVQAGETDPGTEPYFDWHDKQPDPGAPDFRLHYRTDGPVVMIFGLHGSERRLVVLRLARAASAFPLVADLDLAGRRFLDHRARSRW